MSPRLNQPVLDRVPRQLRIHRHMHLVQDAPLVGAHGLVAEIHFPRDVRQPLAAAIPNITFNSRSDRASWGLSERELKVMLGLAAASG